MSNDNEKPVYSIGATARLTGLTTHTLRMWEHRYNAIVPAREPNGRRLYSPADIEKLSLLKTLTDHGSPISSIANLDLNELLKRTEQEQLLHDTAPTGQIRIAAMGVNVPSKLRELARSHLNLEIVATASDPEQFSADLQHEPVDVLITEWPVIDDHVEQMVRTMTAEHAVRHSIVVYRFGRSAVLQSLARAGVRLLRNPLNLQELTIAINTRQTLPEPEHTSADATASANKIQRHQKPVPARRYSAQQLSALSKIATSIDCECPQHLSELLAGLGAFEVYSQNCENRDEKDAELHAYLHHETAKARAVMEAALATLLEAEGIAI